MSKIGVVEIQFNWVFALIAGIVIILLFTTVIARHKDASEASTNAMILRNLDAIFSGSESSAGTASSINIPETKIEFGCNAYTIGGLSKQLISINVFAPSVLEGDSITALTLGWDVPYRAANLIYLTNPRIRYVFVGNSDLAGSLFEMVPKEINKDKYESVAYVQDKDDEEVRLIFFGQVASVPQNIKSAKKLTALQVDESALSLKFYSLEGNEFVLKGESYYLENPGLLGAVFADNKEVYNCTMESALKNLNIASKVYQKKAEALKSRKPDCEYDTTSVTSIASASGTFTHSGIRQIYDVAKQLETQNKELQRRSCPTIY
jgi:hypothetical protein